MAEIVVPEFPQPILLACRTAAELMPVATPRMDCIPSTSARQRRKTWTYYGIGWSPSIRRGGRNRAGLLLPDLDPPRQEFFVQQLKLAREFSLPVILHVRRAVDHVLKHLRRIEVPGGIAHAFNGSRQQAETFSAGIQAGDSAAPDDLRGIDSHPDSRGNPTPGRHRPRNRRPGHPAGLADRPQHAARTTGIADRIARLRGMDLQEIGGGLQRQRPASLPEWASRAAWV